MYQGSNILRRSLIIIWATVNAFLFSSVSAATNYTAILARIGATQNHRLLYDSTTNTTSSSDNKLTPTPRIVGGHTTSLGEYKSFGRSSGGSFFCGGTLIHPDIFLTAGHCQGAFSGVYIGGNSLTKSNLGEYIPISKEIRHPLYMSSTFSNDIMLLKLQWSSKKPVQKLSFNSSIPKVNDPLTVVGFGFTSEDAYSLSDDLREVSIKALDTKSCINYWSKYGYTVNSLRQICAGDLRGGKDSCQGDSGGPLYYMNQWGTQVQVGLVSYGYGCAVPNSPPVYTRIAAYKSFIQETICKESSVPPKSC